ILRRLHANNEVALEAEAQRAEVRFSDRERPERFVLEGDGGAVLRVVPELLTGSAATAERHPLELRAARFSGGFEPNSRGILDLSWIRAEGVTGTPIVIVPLYDAPPEARFRF